METAHPRPPFAPSHDATAAAATNPKLSTSSPTSQLLQQQQQEQRQQKHSQMDTEYVNMLLALDDIPTAHNLLAAFFNWIYLAGFVLFPGTFTSLKALSAENGGTIPAGLIDTVTRLPL